MSELKAYHGDIYVPVYGSIADAEVYLKKDVDEVIAQLKQKLEDVQASMYCDVVDANMKVRMLCRALYKACANWAYWVDHALTTKFLSNNSYITKLERDRWYNMELKCRAKSEEYK